MMSCASPKLACRSARMLGSAMLTMNASMIAMKAPVSVTARPSQRFGAVSIARLGVSDAGETCWVTMNSPELGSANALGFRSKWGLYVIGVWSKLSYY